MNELRAVYNLYGDTIEFFTGNGEDGAVRGTAYTDNDICIYRNLNKDKKLTYVTINNVSRVIVNNNDILEFIVDGKLKLATLLSYLPKKVDADYKAIMAELTKFVKTNKVEVDITQLINYLNEEAS